MLFNFVHPKANRPYLFPDVTPDIDNQEKLVLDSMNDCVYADDKQVVQTHCYQRYTYRPPAWTWIGVRILHERESASPFDVYTDMHRWKGVREEPDLLSGVYGKE